MLFPKRPRIVDPEVVSRYHDEHPRCEVCDDWAMPTPHHLVPRSRLGGDVVENLVSLCATHHVGNEGWHPLGGREWLRRFGARLSDDAVRKVRAALGLEEGEEP